MNVKVNDTVLVITGKYKGKQGKVLAAFPKMNKVVVEGVGIVHKHEKARKANENSKIVTEESPIDVSNVEVVCAKCGKATRVGYTVVNGKKVRVCKKCGEVLEKAASVKKSKKSASKETPKEEAPKKRTRKRSAKAAAESAEPETKSESTVESTPADTGN